MTFKQLTASDGPEVARLFHGVFLESEGPEEGRVVSTLARELSKLSEGRDVIGYASIDDSALTGVIYFSRMTFESGLEAFLLAPVAVSTAHQGQGVGQTLIRHGLNAMANDGVQFVATYGDPAFYARFGFESISEETIRPPFPLSQPIGWLGQTLDGTLLGQVSGSFVCVEPFNAPALW